MKTPRVLCYLRVSTQQQVEKWSLGAQRHALAEHAKRQGWEILGWHEDAGISGSTIEQRPAMLALLADVAERRPDYVLVVELERLSRGGGGDWDRILEACAAAGTRIATPSQVLDPNAPEDSFLTDLFAALSRRERKKTVERTKRGMRERVRSGRWPGGCPPYGYALGPDGRLTPVPAEAKVVRRVFEEVLAGNTFWGLSCAFNRERVPCGRAVWTVAMVQSVGAIDPRRAASPAGELPPELRHPGPEAREPLTDDEIATMDRIRAALAAGTPPIAIVRDLNRENVPRVRRGAWTASNVRRMTGNRVYVGEVHLADGHHARRESKDPVVVSDAHPAIIRADVYERVQEVLRARFAARLPRSRRESGYLLTGLMPCPRCGDRMIGATTRRPTKSGKVLHRYYVCTGAFRPNGKYCGRMRADDVEAAVLAEIAKALSGPDVLERVRRRAVEDVMRGSTDLQKRRAELETALAESRRRVEVMYQDRLAGALSRDTFARLSKTEEERQQTYERALADLDAEVLALGRGADIGRLLGLLADVRGALTTLTRAELKELVQLVVSEVRVLSEKPSRVELRWRLPGMAGRAGAAPSRAATAAS